MRPRFGLTGVQIALLAGALMLAVLFVFSLSDSRRRLSGSSETLSLAFVANPGPGARACADGQRVPAGTGAIGIVADSAGRPAGPLRIEIFAGERPLSRGSLRPGVLRGYSEARVDPVPARVEGARLCVANAGTGPVSLGGDPASGPENRLSITYLRGEPETWWATAGRAVDRFGLGKGSLFGGWTPWAALLLVVGAWACAVRAVLLGERAS